MPLNPVLNRAYGKPKETVQLDQDTHRENRLSLITETKQGTGAPLRA